MTLFIKQQIKKDCFVGSNNKNVLFILSSVQRTSSYPNSTSGLFLNLGTNDTKV